MNLCFKKQLDKFTLDMEFSVHEGEILAILGESGCGKSTLLNLISGVLRPDYGKAELCNNSNNRVYFDSGLGASMPIHKRRIGYIQQKSNLFPHLTVLENIRYGTHRRENTKQIKNQHNQHLEEQINKFCDIFQLKEHLQKYPWQLSGGQQQRVAIVRAVMTDPDILLFDEPFSALDNLLRDCLRRQLIALKKLLNIPILFVTHDLEEAYALGDRTLFAHQGRLVEIGTTDQIFHYPSKLQTAKFVGFHNIIPASFLSESEHSILAQTQTGKLKLTINRSAHHSFTSTPISSQLFIGIKPSNVLFVREDKTIPDGLSANLFPACILEETSLCDTCKLKVQVSGLESPLSMKLSYYTKEKYKLQPGKQILISLRPEHLILLEA